MLKSKEVFSHSEVWNDGIINILNAKNGVILSNRVEGINFGERTVGIKRFYSAKDAGDEIVGMISIPYGVDIRPKDLLELKNYGKSCLDDGFYFISQIQTKDTAPKSLYVSLKKGSVMPNDNRPEPSV